MSASTISHSSPPPTENGGRSSASKKLKSNTDRSWITVVAVIAYVTGVATGILFSQSSVPLFSAQSSQSEAILPNCPSSTSSSSSSSSVKALNKTMEENRRIREDQKQLQEEKQGLERQVQELTLQQQNQTQSLEKQVEQLNQQVQKLRKSSNIPTPYKTGKENELPLFPETVKQLVVDYATVPRDDFNELLDIGVPYDQTDGGGGQEVVLLYTTPAAIPSVHSKTNKFGLNATEAMENCNVVKVILQQRHNHRRKGVQQCIAIVPNWDSFYVHNFQRLPKQESSTNVVGEHLKAPGHFVDAKFPLRYTARNVENDGTYFEPVPRNDWYTLPFYKVLAEYFGHFDRILKEVRSFIKTNVTITDSSTTMNNKQTLVVMTVNKGQSVLFHNFVCHSRKRGIDLSHVIMFATDETALQLCRDLGIPAFYDESIYGKFPEDAAGYYGDKTFGKMMLAKIICVHLALYSNYNVLFQDVDVLWFKVRSNNDQLYHDTARHSKFHLLTCLSMRCMHA
jgi:TolA-binding protein